MTPFYVSLIWIVFPIATHCRKHPVNGRYTRNIEDYELSVPHKLTFTGDFVSFELPHYYEPQFEAIRGKRSMRDEDVIHLGLHANNQLHHAVLWPNYALISPDLLIEYREPENIQKTKFYELPDEGLCYYRGVIRGKRNSRVALSTCDGLIGHINIDNQMFFIEPLDDHEPNEEGHHLHVVYKRDTPEEFDDFDILFEGKDVDEKKCRSSENDAYSDDLIIYSTEAKDLARPKRYANSSSYDQRYIETMIVCDKRFLEYHRDLNRERFILTVVNMAADYLHDTSIGQQIDLVLVRLLYLDKEEKELSLRVTSDAKKTLKSFCKWQQKFNPPDGNPAHADIALMFSRQEICHGIDCQLIGQSFIGAPCEKDTNCAFCEDNGLELGLVIAHQVGHLLGANDDDTKKTECPPNDPRDNTPYIMSPNTNLSAIRWSECSKRAIADLLGGGFADCMLDRPPPTPYIPKPALPGVVYDWEAQCQFVVPGSLPCPTQESQAVLCEELRCLKPSKDKEDEKLECFSLGRPPGDGTKCEENMWCFQGKCVKSGQRPETVDGDWSPWGDWSACTRSCGRGVTYAQRECNNPLPANGGRYCDGDKIRYKICNADACPENATSFRQQQCEEYDDVPDEEGKKHKYKAFLNPEATCSLWCTTEEDENEELNQVAKDGTRCKPGKKNVCVNGDCWKVGCDNMLNSAAVEDACGTCNGDGTGCKIIQNTFTEIGNKDYTTVDTFPIGVRKILIEELAPSPNVIVIMDKTEKIYYLNGKYTEQSDGVYKFGKVEGVYTHKAVNQEKLTIKGPLTEDLVFKILFLKRENVGYRYQYAEMESDSTMEASFRWEVGEMSDCSARCGGGTQIARLHCFEQKAGLVSDTFCTTLKKPELPTQHCNMHPCSTRWQTGKWGQCDACKENPGVRKRGVECVEENPSPLGEAILVENDRCPDPPPGTTKVCTSNKPCKTKRYVHNIPHSHLGDVWIKMQPKTKKDDHKRGERAVTKKVKKKTKSRHKSLLGNLEEEDQDLKAAVSERVPRGSFVLDLQQEKSNKFFIYPLKKTKDAKNKGVTLNDDKDPVDTRLGDLEEDTDKIKRYKGKEAAKLFKELVRFGKKQQKEQEKKDVINSTTTRAHS